MTPDQIAQVQSSFAKVVPIADTAAEIFYARLFEVAPDVRVLFPDDLAEQKKKLVAMLAVAVNGLTRLEQILPAVQALGARHAGYGATADHYPVVGSALIWTLRTGLGDDFTPDCEEAWAAAYGLLSGAMIGAAEQAA